MGKWVAGILATVIAGLILWFLTEKLTNREPVIFVESIHGSLGIKNNRDEVIRVRIAYLYRKDGSSTFCYPFPTAADVGEQDPKLLPNEKKMFPYGKCNEDFNGFNIKVWDAQYKSLIYEIDG